MQLEGKPVRSKKKQELAWALGASVVLGLAPGIVLARLALAGRFPSGRIEYICAHLCTPGILLTPLPHMGPISLVVTIPMNMLFYFGLTLALIWLIRRFGENM